MISSLLRGEKQERGEADRKNLRSEINKKILTGCNLSAKVFMLEERHDFGFSQYINDDRYLTSEVMYVQCS
jgi:hypothetical protein